MKQTGKKCMQLTPLSLAINLDFFKKNIFIHFGLKAIKGLSLQQKKFNSKQGSSQTGARFFSFHSLFSP